MPLGRLKTGTPPRLDGATLDYGALVEQGGDEEPVMFSALSLGPVARQVSCHITRTNARTHDLVASNLSKSPMYSGMIEGRGPRYCPSIEDKVARFPDRSAHQIFLEPEGLESGLVYPNGISTSLPAEIQEDFVRTIAGLGSARIVQPGYAVEYDFIDPRSLDRRLACREFPGLFRAGQINGTTGYEEAAAQGLIAGLNAAAMVLERPTVLFDRADGYIGVLVDDLVTQGVREPYRMFTSRAEYRLHLRADNADARLTPKGISLGCVSEERRCHFEGKMQRLEQARTRLCAAVVTPAAASRAGVRLARDGVSRTALDLLSLADVSSEDIRRLWPDLAEVHEADLEQLAKDACYAPYLARQARDIVAMREQQSRPIPVDFDYAAVSGLSSELVEKLCAARPSDLAQAGRIDGMTPAGLALVLAHVRRRATRSAV
jgi:tRNA uridine 5-carboxymethylaminomethyl modification enzyme